MTEKLEKSGNFMRGKKWEPCDSYFVLFGNDRNIFEKTF